MSAQEPPLFSLDLHTPNAETEIVWWEAAGCSANPFASPETPEAFFHSPKQHQKLTLFLQTLAQGREKLCCFEGARGVGKTIFFQSLLERISSEYKVASLSATPELLGSLLPELLAMSLGLSLTAVDSTHLQLDELVAALVARSQPAVLLIDAAEALSTQFLHQLFYLHHLCVKQEAPLTIVLLGQLGFPDAWPVQELTYCRPGAWVRWMLEPFDVAETQAYLTHCFCEVGLLSEMPFSTQDVLDIHARSDGNAARIQCVAQTLLQARDVEETPLQSTCRTFWARHQTRLMAVSVLGLALFLSVFTVFLVSRDGLHKPHHIALSLPKTEPVGAQTVETLPPPSPVVFSKPSPMVPKPRVLPPKQTLKVSHPLVHTHAAKPVTRHKQHAPKRKVHRTSHPRAHKAAHSVLKPYFTWQLMGASTRATLERFVTQHHLKNVRIVSSAQSGKPWFVLTSGQYATREAAHQATLSPTLRALHPWVRRVGS